MLKLNDMGVMKKEIRIFKLLKVSTKKVDIIVRSMYEFFCEIWKTLFSYTVLKNFEFQKMQIDV